MANAPRVRVTRFLDEQGREVFIDAWLFVGGLERYVKEHKAGVAYVSVLPMGHLP